MCLNLEKLRRKVQTVRHHTTPRGFIFFRDEVQENYILTRRQFLSLCSRLLVWLCMYANDKSAHSMKESVEKEAR